MNRADRRKVKKQMRGKNVFLEKGVNAEEHKNHEWCHRHNLQLEDVAHPTERDKRLIASVTFVTKKQVRPDGKVRVYKTCPRCHQTVELDVIDRPLLA